ncbi:putative SLC26A/SulP transporter [Helianthus annuus]|nr:putative SLC26A/SulP transporter [Helianthus annuus]
MRKPKLFWVSAAAPLASVILSTVVVALFESNLTTIATVRKTQFKLYITSFCPARVAGQ